MHRKTPISLLLAVTATALALSSVAAADPSNATWFVAPGGSDASTCSIASEPCATVQAAIAKAAAGDTVKLAVGTYTSAAAAVVMVDKSLTIQGGWSASFAARAGLSVVDGQGARPGVVVAGGVDARMERLQIENGARALWPVAAGGVTNSGVLTLEESVVRGNRDGGILNLNRLTVIRSTISGNTNSLSTMGGGITSSWMGNPTTVVVNSTISGNTSGEGGGIFIGRPLVGSATVSLSNVTISGNQAPYGGGGGVLVEGPTTLRLRNSIVARNTANFGSDVERRGGFVVSDGYNLLGSIGGFGGLTLGPGDRLFTDPMLGSLQANGGPTETHALLDGSPGIDAGNPAGCTDADGIALTKDQRGATRTFGVACDIGAYEFGATLDVTPPVLTVPTEVTVDAVSPAGSAVSFVASAVDGADGTVPTTCLPPSGSTFPIGTTTVVCTASDGAGNSASASFPVRVRGADEQIASLLALVSGVGPGSSLTDKLVAARTALAAGDTAGACSNLRAFGQEVAVQAGKRLTTQLAAELGAAAAQIRRVMGC